MTNIGFFSVLTLAFVHLFANQSKVLGWLWHGRFLSFAAGISFAYVFVDLLPALEKGLPVLQRAFGEIVPYLNRHTYVIALIGMIFYYGLHVYGKNESIRSAWASLSGSLLFNFLIGGAFYDSGNPEIQPIVLFTVAVAMHYFITDHLATKNFPEFYSRQARWALVVSLFTGYFIGYITQVPDTIAAIAISFAAGGVLLNVLGYELPKKEKRGYPYFVLGALLYTFIILLVGEV